MDTFMIGILMALVPGLVTGYVLAGLTGWAMRRDDYCRHPVPTPPATVPVGGAALRDPVARPVAPTVVYVHVHQEGALPRPGESPSRVIDAQVVRELPSRELPSGGVTS